MNPRSLEAISKTSSFQSQAVRPPVLVGCLREWTGVQTKKFIRDLHHYLMMWNGSTGFQFSERAVGTAFVLVMRAHKVFQLVAVVRDHFLGHGGRCGLFCFLESYSSSSSSFSPSPSPPSPPPPSSLSILCCECCITQGLGTEPGCRQLSITRRALGLELVSRAPRLRGSR